MNRINLLFIAIFSSLIAFAQQIESSVKAKDATSVTYTVEDVVTELNIPWGMVFLPEGGMLITEKSGEIIHFKDGVKTEIHKIIPIKEVGVGLELQL